jgi:hypothetical protein
MTFLGCETETIVYKHAYLEGVPTDSTHQPSSFENSNRQDETKGSELFRQNEPSVLQLTREEVLLLTMNIEEKATEKPLLPLSPNRKDRPDKRVKIEILPSPNEEGRLKERTIISAIILAFITEEFSFKTVYGEYFRF